MLEHFSLKSIVRPNIWALKPYRCARDDYTSGILLDANENSMGPVIENVFSKNVQNTTSTINPDTHLERYPDPHQHILKKLWADFRGVPSPNHFFVGVGSDESIDLIMRIFCIPGKDKILICPPTYGMYSVCAQINDIDVVKVPLDVEDGAFQIKVNDVSHAFLV